MLIIEMFMHVERLWIGHLYFCVVFHSTTALCVACGLQWRSANVGNPASNPWVSNVTTNMIFNADGGLLSRAACKGGIQSRVSHCFAREFDIYNTQRYRPFSMKVEASLLMIVLPILCKGLRDESIPYPSPYRSNSYTLGRAEQVDRLLGMLPVPRSDLGSNLNG